MDIYMMFVGPVCVILFCLMTVCYFVPKFRKYLMILILSIFVISCVIPIIGFSFGLFESGGSSNFDHYKTDIDIVVNTDGSITQTEKYYFRWSNQESREMYISIPWDKAIKMDSDLFVVKIDGNIATKAESYYNGRQEAAATTDNNFAQYWDSSSVLDSVKSLKEDGREPSANWGMFEINAFYKLASQGEHIVEFCYEVEDIFNKYDDCVDFYYKVFTHFSEDQKNLTVNVTMPTGSLQSKTRIYGHGDPNGVASFNGNNAIFTSSMLRANTMFEIRVVNEQVELYTEMTAKTTNTFSSILTEEQKFYDDTQRAILFGKVQIGIICLMAACTVFYVVFRIKLLKRNKPNFNEIYVRDIPTIKPNLVATLGNYYKMRKAKFSNKITATILNLAFKKVIAIEEGENKDLIFVFRGKKRILTGFEKNVYDLLYLNAKRTGWVTLKEIKKSLSKFSGRNSTLMEQALANDKDDFNCPKYVDVNMTKQNFKWRIIPVFLVLGFILINVVLSIIAADFLNMGVTIFVGVVAIAVLIYLAIKLPKSLTVIGEDEHTKVKALKRFYTDMTLLKERQALELSIWEQHLVYATALGVAKKVIKELEVRMQDMSISTDFSTLIYINTFSSCGGLSSSFSSISTSISSTVSPSSFSGSSDGGSGGGGGFSGGGGGGSGGGGGGHR